ncbi:PREDICTED: uncharacterized protein LOC105462253 [Wasmannia auropunctata]|uniref:uncharacterized protein LOC105462253 n=1 Tax=Wasmannia auropunctata TaxID=64793 RepID=UPI0005EFAB7D|nr:PREDICTED: uncharacterized protein LOC105462253 [Wasmannia auropunctata]
MAVMRKKVTIKEVIFVIKLSQFPILCWPMPHDTTKFKLMCVKLYHCLCIIISIALQLPLIYGIQKHLDEPEILVNQIVLLSSITHSIFNFIFHMVNYRHVQNVTYEMLQFCNAMKPREEVIIQRYVDKCLIFHSFSMGNIVFVTFATAAIIPFVTGQTFPVMAEYPFDVYYQPLKTIIYIHHTIAGSMIGAQVCTNIFMALLLWFTSARFEILIEEMKEATNVYQLYECIKKHQHLLNNAFIQLRKGSYNRCSSFRINNCNL